MLLGRQAGHRLEPVREVGGPVLHGPLAHRGGDDVGDRRVERRALLDRIPQGLVDVLRQPRLHDLVGEDVDPEQLPDRRVRAGGAATGHRPPRDRFHGGFAGSRFLHDIPPSNKPESMNCPIGSRRPASGRSGTLGAGEHRISSRIRATSSARARTRVRDLEPGPPGGAHRRRRPQLVNETGRRADSLEPQSRGPVLRADQGAANPRSRSWFVPGDGPFTHVLSGRARSNRISAGETPILSLPTETPNSRLRFSFEAFLSLEGGLYPCPNIAARPQATETPISMRSRGYVTRAGGRGRETAPAARHPFGMDSRPVHRRVTPLLQQQSPTREPDLVAKIPFRADRGTTCRPWHPAWRRPPWDWSSVPPRSPRSRDRTSGLRR